MGPWFLCLLLGLIPFCWFALSNFSMIVFASSYYIVFYHVRLLSLGSLSFSNERQKRSGSEWERAWRKAARSRGRENCMREESVFNKRKNSETKQVNKNQCGACWIVSSCIHIFIQTCAQVDLWPPDTHVHTRHSTNSSTHMCIHMSMHTHPKKRNAYNFSG